MCDIEQMFYQFRGNPEHRNNLRFLWWDNEKITEYRMTIHLFGASSSPGCANFALKQAAKDGESQFSREAVECAPLLGLTSVDSVEDAMQLVHDSKELCAMRGIRLHKFISNSKEVMLLIPSAEHAKELQNLDLLAGPLPKERALSVCLCAESDSFRIHIALTDGVLSTISSIYDPLGFLSPVVLRGKMILQELCRNGTDWDDPTSTSTKELGEMETRFREPQFLLSRKMYEPRWFSSVVKTELHYFSDACTSGYGQCAYIRLVDDVCSLCSDHM